MLDDEGIGKLRLSEFVESLTPEQLTALVADAQVKMSRWMELAKLRDETGLPIDIIYLKLREHNRLPVIVSHGVARPVSSDEFEESMCLCIQIRQCGGLDAVLSAITHLMQATVPGKETENA